VKTATVKRATEKGQLKKTATKNTRVGKQGNRVAVFSAAFFRLPFLPLPFLP